MKRAAPLKRSELSRKRVKPKRRAVSPASPAQRAMMPGAVSIVSGQRPCDPAHIVPRSLGGCDHVLCCVPLTRREHRDYDAGRLDLEPYLIGRCIPELQHALEHTQGSLTGLLRIVSGSA